MSTVEDGGGKKGLEFKDPSLTKQNERDDVDINLILARFFKTGQIPMDRFNPPGQSGDLSSAGDFKSAMNVVVQSQKLFSELSAEVRKRFGNDPANFLEFMEDSKNVDEAIELGLIKPEDPPPGPQKVEVVNPPAPKEEGKK